MKYKEMTQEEKQLLIKDLCARLPYGVKVCARFNTGSRYTADVTAICADRDYIETRQNVLHTYRGSSVEDIRPYLRPLSSMTEEEGKEWEQLLNYNLSDENEMMVTVFVEDTPDYIDWFHEHHFDYRGLIEKGLALEAPEGMYKTE